MKLERLVWVLMGSFMGDGPMGWPIFAFETKADADAALKEAKRAAPLVPDPNGARRITFFVNELPVPLIDADRRNDVREFVAAMNRRAMRLGEEDA